MNEQENVVALLEDIKALLSQNKKVLNVEDLSQYTGLSKSKIYKLTHLRLIPMGNNKHIRQKFFDKDAIDEWLMGNSELLDDQLEHEFNRQLLKKGKS
ncbi:helix-turn-helix transcriptional regulator [Galbibacter mesophilus]|uniref:helix-turn-helix transcriptional regulator n=1 Tax=Galbibacter mesophilus TaxID=379069 RepID=UPI00191CF303|nr:helix-turn-helix domain-containing protein [Galbibacter mesophilus]MCM5662522.1 helix-turn-helix domain-containing protein [Galbibacter mesophilus]